MISRLGMAGRVLSLTTLGTPHRGTVFADWGVRQLECVAKPIFWALGIPTQAFYDLTTQACAEFNRQVPDAPQVRYFSVAAQHDGSLLFPEWLLPYHIVLEGEGANDGVVSVASASYGQCTEIWNGDHMSLVNWSHPLMGNRQGVRDSWPRFAALLRRLVE
jgi:triacylglycerol lipase